MQGDTVWSLVAIPLTPIHVGDGTFLSPEDYDLDRSDLVRFSPSLVLRDMQPAARKAYADALDRGELQGAWRVIRQARREPHELERVAVGAAALGEIRQLFDGDQRKGEIRPMLRTGGRPCLPGSSLKGALRTAVLSARLSRHKRDVEADIRRHRRPNGGLFAEASDAVQAGLLGHRTTDQDPFRFVKVSDVVLPAAATQIDRVVNWRPARLLRDGAQPAEKMQMLFERLRASCDGPGSPSAAVTLAVSGGLRERAAKLDREGRKTPSRPVSAEELVAAANKFHWRLLDEERERFFADEPTVQRALSAAFRVRLADGRLLDEAGMRARSDMILLRVGRFGQFESKSLAGVREGWNAQAKPARPMTQGNTRNLAKLAEGAALIPFGWLLLAPEGTEPAGDPPTIAPTGSPRSGPGGGPRLSGARRWRLDDKINEEVSRDADEVTVRLSNRDIDVVPPDELEPL